MVEGPYGYLGISRWRYLRRESEGRARRERVVVKERMKFREGWVSGIMDCGRLAQLGGCIEDIDESRCRIYLVISSALGMGRTAA